MFNQHAELCVKGAKEMVGLMTNFDDLENRVHAIESIEKQADKITYTTVDLLHKTFITPLDRDDIHKLITRMRRFDHAVTAFSQPGTIDARPEYKASSPMRATGRLCIITRR